MVKELCFVGHSGPLFLPVTLTWLELQSLQENVRQKYFNFGVQVFPNQSEWPSASSVLLMGVLSTTW